jgi:hypothetical protein
MGGFFFAADHRFQGSYTININFSHSIQNPSIEIDKDIFANAVSLVCASIPGAKYSVHIK